MKHFRSGAIGAMMDEYERAAADLKTLLATISDADYERIVDTETTDEQCRSMQTVMGHVVNSGYGYAGYIRKIFNITDARPERKLSSRHESIAELDAMLRYTVETLEGKWTMPDEEIDKTVIDSNWKVRYTIEQLLEHAIVHILRHRRQIEKFLLR